ncbi:MAG: V-type ATPase subunit [Candidatus Omnitrophica bacterium]|nr:V-type ATPase subunit [Candidatus Omnitrophota bacterium]HOX54083.1 V-type ATPase subunit [Candidatus Omnitrophota bacterium]
MKNKTPISGYIFAVGRIRALERFLIKQEALEEAIESDLGEALRILVEAGSYSDGLLRIHDSQDLENILREELAKLKTFMENLILDDELIELVRKDSISEMQKIVQLKFGGFLEDYIRHAVDMHNIKTFLRLYLLKEKIDKLQNLVLEGGFVSKETLLKLYQQDLSFFIARLEYVHKDSGLIDYSIFLKDAIRNLVEKKSFLMLEKAINDFLMEILKPAKYISYGPEPLIAYYFAKTNEINLVRMIILAKLNDLSKDLVKERLSEVYA